MAFLMMPFFAIIGGFVDIGMALFIWNTLQNAVREGTRYAITYQVDSSNSQVTSIKNRVSTWAMGMVDPTKTSTSTPAAPYIDVSFYTKPTTANPNGSLTTASNGNAPGNIVQVSILQYPYALLAPFSGSLSAVTAQAFYRAPGSNIVVQVFSADVLGGAPAGGTPAM